MVGRAPLMLRVSLCSLLAACGAAHALAQTSTGPAATPPAASPANLPGELTTADQVLTKLETADQGLTSLQAEIMLHRTFVLEGDEQTRWGMLYFRQQPALQSGSTDLIKQFCVRFDQRKIGQRVEEKEQRFVFDGEWLTESNPAEKTFSKRQLVGPGEHLDPLRVGQGPIPLPIGQKKADILERFNVELVPAADGIVDGDDAKQAEQWRKFVQGSYQLKLIPKAAGGDEDFTEIRLWYKPAAKQEGIEDGRLLPRMARTTNHAGDVTNVQLVGVKINFDLASDFFDTRTPDQRGERGWDINVIPFRKVQPVPAQSAPVSPAPEAPGGGNNGPAPSGSAPPGAESPASPASPK